MFLFVGLGNPDPKHKNNRHNIGFMIIDHLNKRFNLSKQKPKFKGLLTNGEINEKKLILVKSKPR
jgi:PTH1 family peptidyl-tRNA hydrolase